jgi:galactokinase
VTRDDAVCWRAPGRVNLIGEHTDYNDGFVLPFAIEHACTATVRRLPEPIVRVSSAQRPEVVQLTADELAPGVGGWAGYAAGVVWALRSYGVDVPGLEVALDSSVPIGAGLSSSAALVCSVTTALDDLLGLELTKAQLLDVSRRAENGYVGAPTGGVDQLAALGCEAGSALFCDMRTLEVAQVPLDLAADGLAVLVIDTRAEHRHVDGEYRSRREGCERAASLLGVPALRDVAIDDLDSALKRLPSDDLRRYTRHVVTENHRVLSTVELLRSGRLADVGQLLTKSHESLRDDFRVSIPELDAAVAALLAAGARGARLIGGGFGGCVVALLDASHLDAATHAVSGAFDDHGYAAPLAFTVTPSAGAQAVRC